MLGVLFKTKGTMTQKEITINGKTYPVVFTVKTLIGFEDVYGSSFFGKDFRNLGQKTVLVYAAIVAADEKTDLKLDDLMNTEKAQTLDEIVDAFQVVDSLAGEFFKKPAVEPDPEPAEEKEGDDSKN